MTTQARIDPERAVSLLKERFLNREDVIAVLAPWGKPCPVTATDIDAVLLGHVVGDGAPVATVRYEHARGKGTMTERFRVGAYCPAPDGTTKWLCIDFDGAGHANALADPKAAALNAMDRAERLALPAYLEQSGGGNGWHLWCFFAEPLAASSAKRLGLALAPSDAPLAKGGIAEPKKGRGIEVFPKQRLIKQGGFGNLVWLPWWANARGPGCQFFRVQSDALAPYVPTSLEVASSHVIEAALSGCLETVRPSHEDAIPRPEGIDWKTRRERVLTALPLEAVYGEWLTGKPAGPGWLECRDPDSPSGDKNPSAGVADGSGDAERGAFHSFISGETISVFDFLIARSRVPGFREAMTLVSELGGINQSRDAKAGAVQRDALGRPIVRYEQSTSHVAVLAGIKALGKEPSIYQRAQRLVRVVPKREFRDPLETTGAPPLVTTLSAPSVWEFLSRQVAWRKFDGRCDAFVPCEPPDRIVSAVHKRGAWDGVRILSGITSIPILRSDGSVRGDPGYDPATGLLYEPTGPIAPLVPDPSRDDARAAAKALCDVVCDFPFAGPVHQSAWLAALLSPIAWPAYQDGAPLFLFDAHTPGSGKTLLCDAIGVIASGRSMVRSPYVADDDEIRKRITAHALSGDQLVLIDNVPTGGSVGWPSLDSALTGERWKDRVLSKSENADLRLNIVWYVTGNNLSVNGDLARRSLRVRLESFHERPEERSGFRHSPLVSWLHTERPRLVAQALTLLRAYLLAGQPSQDLSSFGSFEAWSKVVREAIVWAGLPDPARTCLSKDPEADAVRDVHVQALVGWRRLAGGGAGLTVAQALRLLEEDQRHQHQALRSALLELCPTRSGLPSTRSLSRRLRGLKGRWRSATADEVSLRLSFAHADSKARGGIVRWCVKEASNA